MNQLSLIMTLALIIMFNMLEALDKGKYVPPGHSSTPHPDSSSVQPGARDKKIQELEEKVERLEAQITSLLMKKIETPKVSFEGFQDQEHEVSKPTSPTTTVPDSAP
ncbi:hypothetical protein L1987_20053 [Smallanthus sonchifolius]|uniref:Uncharacterized protein n=1 Tax=Smallanthus sonchifolius TaxID=185202 RepID=A0ACB9IRK1_9ASTR|nr:hypothetical protein L1987_20053 [Smallanthus sonchifolius]